MTTPKPGPLLDSATLPSATTDSLSPQPLLPQLSPPQPTATCNGHQAAIDSSAAPSPAATPAPPTRVTVMLPLDTISAECVFRYAAVPWFSQALNVLATSGVHSVAFDVWWGAVEREPRSYNWSAYKHLMEVIKPTGLKVQVVLSFHACGGNVGDTTNVPLPSWVLQSGQSDPDLFFMDRPRGNAAGQRNREYVSIWSDDEAGVLCGRSPMQCYEDLMSAFREAFEQELGTLIDEVVVGSGPCGELRYPAYLEAHGWKFPGIGEFQCYDRRALASLATAARLAGHPEWGASGPHDAGDYNSVPEDTGFFKAGGTWSTAYGRFFLDWYSGCLLRHGDRLLAAASLTLLGAQRLQPSWVRGGSLPDMHTPSGLARARSAVGAANGGVLVGCHSPVTTAAAGAAGGRGGGCLHRTATVSCSGGLSAALTEGNIDRRRAYPLHAAGRLPNQALSLLAAVEETAPSSSASSGETVAVASSLAQAQLSDGGLHQPSLDSSLASSRMALGGGGLAESVSGREGVSTLLQDAGPQLKHQSLNHTSAGGAGGDGDVAESSGSGGACGMNNRQRSLSASAVNDAARSQLDGLGLIASVATPALSDVGRDASAVGHKQDVQRHFSATLPQASSPSSASSSRSLAAKASALASALMLVEGLGVCNASASADAFSSPPHHLRPSGPFAKDSGVTDPDHDQHDRVRRPSSPPDPVNGPTSVPLSLEGGNTLGPAHTCGGSAGGREAGGAASTVAAAADDRRLRWDAGGISALGVSSNQPLSICEAVGSAGPSSQRSSAGGSWEPFSAPSSGTATPSMLTASQCVPLSRLSTSAVAAAFGGGREQQQPLLGQPAYFYDGSNGGISTVPYVVASDPAVSTSAPVAPQGAMTLSLKVAGVHWWFRSASHAAELTAGYGTGSGTWDAAYRRLVDKCAKHRANLTLTCVEMCDAQHPPGAACGPEGLLFQIRMLAAQRGVSLSGENALPIFLHDCVDSVALDRVVANVRGGAMVEHSPSSSFWVFSPTSCKAPSAVTSLAAATGGGAASQSHDSAASSRHPAGPASISSGSSGSSRQGYHADGAGRTHDVSGSTGAGMSFSGPLLGTSPTSAKGPQQQQQQQGRLTHSWSSERIAQSLAANGGSVAFGDGRRVASGSLTGAPPNLSGGIASRTSAAAMAAAAAPPPHRECGGVVELPPMRSFTMLRMGPELLQPSHQLPWLRFMQRMKAS